jgi:hypothetical protein
MKSVEMKGKNMMKPLLILLLSIGTANATLIDLTPGGFDPSHPPPVFIDWDQHHFGIDSFGIAFENINSGWAPPPYLGPPFFNTTPLGQMTAVLTWDLTGTPFIFNYLFVGGFVDNMYQVTPDQYKLGEAIVTMDGVHNIFSIGIYGFPSVHTPDSGSTALLLLLGLAAVVVQLGAIKRRQPHQS